jgi:hypothetical protein
VIELHLIYGLIGSPPSYLNLHCDPFPGNFIVRDSSSYKAVYRAVTGDQIYQSLQTIWVFVCPDYNVKVDSFIMHGHVCQSLSTAGI